MTLPTHVLFLDFDGPLFPDRYITYCKREPYPGRVEMPYIVDYWEMDPISVNILNSIRKIHNFVTVVSSSWKRFVDREQIEDLFEVNGLELTLHDDYSTPDLNHDYERGMYYTGVVMGDLRAREIEAWLAKHPEVEGYVIIDDPMSGPSLDDHQNHTLSKNSIIMVDPDFGLGSQESLRIRNIMRHLW